MIAALIVVLFMCCLCCTPSLFCSVYYNIYIFIQCNILIVVIKDHIWYAGNDANNVRSYIFLEVFPRIKDISQINAVIKIKLHATIW